MPGPAFSRAVFPRRCVLAALAALALAVTALLGFDQAAAQDETVTWSHGIAMHGEPELPADFSHFPYANPDAPKGGRFTRALHGTFDSLNTYIVRGVAPDR